MVIDSTGPPTWHDWVCWFHDECSQAMLCRWPLGYSSISAGLFTTGGHTSLGRKRWHTHQYHSWHADFTVARWPRSLPNTVSGGSCSLLGAGTYCRFTHTQKQHSDWHTWLCLDAMFSCFQWGYHLDWIPSGGCSDPFWSDDHRWPLQMRRQAETHLVFVRWWQDPRTDAYIDNLTPSKSCVCMACQAACICTGCIDLILYGCSATMMAPWPFVHWHCVWLQVTCFCIKAALALPSSLLFCAEADAAAGNASCCASLAAAVASSGWET